MNLTRKTIILLIESALRKKIIDLNSDVDWNEIFDICAKAQILPMIYDVIGKNNFDMPEDIKNLFKQGALLNIVIDQQQKLHIDNLKKLFTQNNIDFALLKGSVLKNLYNKSFYRPMGDIDILIKLEQYEKIKDIMSELGYDKGKETDHELIWNKRPFIHIELHKRLIPSYNDDFYSYYGDGWSKMQLFENNQYNMSPEDQLIYLITHFAKHYRDGGIGIRHIVDLWVFRNYYNCLNEDYIISELKKLNLDNFYLNTLKTIDWWFNDGVGTIETQLITDTVFASNSYGNKEKSDCSYALRKSKKHSSAFTTKLSNMIDLIFMPLSKMQIKYDILNKSPYLLPAFWVIRWIEALLFKKENIKRQSERTKKITEKNISNYQNELNIVGLDYYF